jgi:endonuclease/exonuclease/phosphatase family metal-dependent hydrolase
MKKILKLLLWTILVLVMAFVGFVAYISLNDYKPESETVVFENANDDGLVLSDSMQISLFSWNLGYCGLNKEMDFFYSGGTQVYPESEVVFNNIQGVKAEMQKRPKVDFMLFQEVDKASTRSYFTNQVDTLSNLFSNYHADFGTNYLVPYVPIPVSKPMGAVNSGLLTLGKYTPIQSVRHSYIGNFAWPKSLFMLDRCFLVNRYKLNNGKQLLIINTHNSAYDDGGLRVAQMKQIKKFVTSEYDKGNYVIVGGDWNQCAPGFEPSFDKDVMDNKSRLDISPDLMPEGWTWFYDNKQPTNRRNSTSYVVGETLTTVIDFFLLSPNVKGMEIHNISNGFTYSDHQPLWAKVQLKPKN